MMMPILIEEVSPRDWYYWTEWKFSGRFRRRIPDPVKLHSAGPCRPDLRLTMLQPHLWGMARTDLI